MMSNLIDLNQCKKELNQYGGSSYKECLIYNGRRYMVKFPDHVREKKNSLKYRHNVFSEYIGCKIYQELGFETQNVFLGIRDYKNKGNKIVVACEDFTQDGKILSEFSKLMIGEDRNLSKGKKSELNFVMKLIDNVDFMPPSIVKERFWDMFIIDSYIKNEDRNINNWGFLKSSNGEVCFAPIYDCASSFDSLSSENKIRYYLSDKNAFKYKVLSVFSAYKIKHCSIDVRKLFDKPNLDLKNAITKIIPIIKKKENKINKIIDSTDCIPDFYREYMKKGLHYRLENILLPVLRKQKKFGD